MDVSTFGRVEGATAPGNRLEMHDTLGEKLFMTSVADNEAFASACRFSRPFCSSIDFFYVISRIEILYTESLERKFCKIGKFFYLGNF